MEGLKRVITHLLNLDWIETNQYFSRHRPSGIHL